MKLRSLRRPGPALLTLWPAALPAESRSGAGTRAGRVDTRVDARRTWHISARIVGVVCLALLSACSHDKPAAQDIDATLLSAIQKIPAIDNHAHPVRNVPKNLPPDHDYDALPVENLEPSSDPLYFRDNAPGLADAWKALYNSSGLNSRQSSRDRVMSEKGDAYPNWVLDQASIEIMFANRVSMGPGIQPPRFRWVPYADALIFPLDNSGLARANSDRKAFFALEDALRARYLAEAGVTELPQTLSEYTAKIVTPTLERQRKGGAVAEKFEAAYLRPLAFDKVESATADQVYKQFRGLGAPPDTSYKALQDYLFRYIAAECGRLGMAVHIHTMAGGGSYFDVGGANPLLLESVLNDPDLRKTKFVMVHGGWPFNREIAALLTKPNASIDISAQSLVFPPATLAQSLREWLEWVPEKVLFGTDAYPYSAGLGWEEGAYLASQRAREALAIALTSMMRANEINRDRAEQLARMVLRDNAKSLYGL